MLSDVLAPDLVASAVRIATPVALAAIGATISERSGVVNIALEGIMLVGAFAGTAVALATGSPWIGVGAAVIAGILFTFPFAYSAISLRTNQIVSATALNILALGLTGYLMDVIYGHPGTTDAAPTLGPVFHFQGPSSGFGASLFAWIDGALLSYTAIVYIAIILAVTLQWAMYKTRWGLRLRALGEHPRAADTVGINVIRGRYLAVLASGALGGLAGANMTLGGVGAFTENMVNGRGFIALAANIFGRWTPGGSYLASLLFGSAEALQVRLQPFRNIIPIPPQFFYMLPYILTVIVLAGFMGRAIAPAAVGKPYKERD